MRDEKGQFIKGHEKIGGITKGSKQKIQREIREMIFQAFENAGGVDYLVQQSQENPVAFLGLLKCIVPKTVNANVEHSIPQLSEAQARKMAEIYLECQTPKEKIINPKSRSAH